MLQKNMVNIRFQQMIVAPNITQVCRISDAKAYIHSPIEKSLIERTIQHIKDRTEGVGDYFPCNNRKKKCNLFHIKIWLNLFVNIYDKKVLNVGNQGQNKTKKFLFYQIICG
jgi:hypothetical protein